MNYNVKVVLSALIALVMFSGTSAFAAEPLKVGIVDLKKCIEQTKAGQARKAELLAKTEQLDERLQALETEARAINDEVKAQQLLLTETLKAEKLRRFQEIRAEAQSIQQQKMKISDDLTKQVLVVIQRVVRSIAEKNGYDMVITEPGPLLYYNKALDITDKVIEASDAEQK